MNDQTYASFVDELIKIAEEGSADFKKYVDQAEQKAADKGKDFRGAGSKVKQVLKAVVPKTTAGKVGAGVALLGVAGAGVGAAALKAHHDKKEKEKTSGALDAVKRGLGGKLNPAIETAGLGTLAIPGVDTLQAAARAKMHGDSNSEKYRLMGDTAHAAADVGGLGMLMGPEIAHLLKKAMMNVSDSVAGAMGSFSKSIHNAPLPSLSNKAAPMAGKLTSAAGKVSPSAIAPPPSLAALVKKPMSGPSGLVRPNFAG